MRKRPKNPIRTGHYSGIGKVIVSWARLEAHIITALESVLRIDKADALVVFWHLSHKERIARLATLFYKDYKDKNDPIRKEFDTLAKRLEVAHNIRNTVAHGVWFKGGGPRSIKAFQMQARGSDVKFTGKGKKGLPPDEFTPERLISEAKKIDRLGTDFREFFKTRYKAKFVYKS